MTHTLPVYIYIYCPPALGNNAPNSAKESAPLIVIKPPTSQTIRMRPGEGKYSAIKPAVINMPEPITAPITSEVESRRFKFLKN